MRGIEEAAASQKKAITDSMKSTQDGSDKAKTEVDDLNKSLEGLNVEPIQIMANPDQALTEISRVRGQLDDLSANSVNLNLNTDAFDKAIDSARKKLEALQSKLSSGGGSNENLNVEITGEASPVRPFTETMNRVNKMVDEKSLKDSTKVRLSPEFNQEIINLSRSKQRKAKRKEIKRVKRVKQYEKMKKHFIQYCCLETRNIITIIP